MTCAYVLEWLRAVSAAARQQQQQQQRLGQQQTTVIDTHTHRYARHKNDEFIPQKKTAEYL